MPEPSSERPSHVGLTSAEAAVAKERAAQLVGRVLQDRYRIDEVIAVGGMGIVYRGEHVRMRKRVAVKVLHPDTKNFDSLAERFEREAIVGAHLRHANVVAATDFGKLDDGSYFLVLELVRGVTLHEIIRQGPVPAHRAVHVARQIAAGLDAAHAMGCVHRDLKPRNIMLVEGRSDLVKLIDFGFARVKLDKLSTVGPMPTEDSPKRPITAAGVVFGTVAYMAPETAFGMDAVDERSDLYALGIILYEMLAGQHPFDATEPGELFHEQRTKAPPPFRVRAPNVVVPEALEGVVMRLLQKEPALRYKSANELIRSLDAALPGGVDPMGMRSWTAALPMSIAGAIEQPEAQVADVGLAPASTTSAGTVIMAPRASDTHADSAPGTTSDAAKTARPPPYQPRLVGRSFGSSSTPKWAPAIVGGVVAGIVVVLALRLTDRPPVLLHADTGVEDVTRPLLAARPAGKPVAPPKPAPSTPRERFRAAMDAKDYRTAAAAILALVEAEPAAFEQRDVAADTVVAASALAFAGVPEADGVFDALATKLGATGVDLLNEIGATRVGSKAAARADELLATPDVQARGTPALRAAYLLRSAPCAQKPQHFAKAGEDGDVRALGLLEQLRSDRCRPRAGQCCFHHDGALDAAATQIRARLP